MNRLNNIENGEIRKSSEASESNFDNEGHKEVINKIQKEKTEQKEVDEMKVAELTEKLFENEKKPINEFIEKYRKEGLNEVEIAKKLIIQGCSWDEFMNSSISKEMKSILEEFKKEAVENPYRYIFRFKDKEDLSNKYLDIMKNALIKDMNFSDAVKSIPLKRAITMEDVRHGERKLHEISPDAGYHIDLTGEILPDFDWSGSKEIFRYISFDDKTFSKTSKGHLPEGFEPKEIFEKGKSIGLGIDDVHKMGYTGKGVGVAICDWQLKPHKDIKTKQYIVEDNAGNIPEYFHASAVSSILAGKQTGIAPDSDLYFFAEKQDDRKEYGGDDLNSAFTKIIEKNKQLSNKEKIRVISISGGLYGEGIKDLAMKLENSGVWVLTSGDFFSDFGYLEKKDPMCDPDNFENYQYSTGKLDAIYVNSGDRTIANPIDENAYIHDPQACASWAVPVVAGYYVLACQADPTMTPEKFKKLARETAHEIDSTIRYEKDGKLIRSTETRKIKVIDIKALIQKIEGSEK